MQREPIFWTSTTANYNAVDRETSVMIDGEERIIRHPQIGHAGDSDYDQRRPAHGLRYIDVVHHNGNIIPLVLTNAAAHMDPNTSYGQLMRAKARHYGWYQPAVCPITLLAVGDLKPNLVLDKSILTELVPCPQSPEPCRHSLSERAARLKKKGEIELKRHLDFKDPTDRMIEAGREQNRELANIIADAMKGGLAAAVPVAPPDPPPAPAPEPAKGVKK